MDVLYNKKINKLFKSLTFLIRDIKKDIINNKKEDYGVRIMVIHKDTDIPDEILSSIEKIDIDEVKISLYEFKMNPYNYIKLLIDHFYMEKKNALDIMNKIESQFILITPQLKKEHFNKAELYKSIVTTKALEKYQLHGIYNPMVTYDNKNEKIILTVGEETIKFDLNI